MMGSCLTKTLKEEPKVSVDMKEKYTFGRLIGKGASGRVIQAIDNQNKENTVAIKIMSKEKSFCKRLYSNEINILSHLSQHNTMQDNIIQLISHLEDNDNCYIVMNLCEGGELFDHIVNPENKLTEKIAQSIIKQLLLIIESLHQQNIVHRDIRPENILFKSDDTNSNIVLIDFATAKFVEDSKEYKDICGTVYYLSPEIAAFNPLILQPNKQISPTGKVWKCADIWSIGIIAYLMLMKVHPFRGRNNKEIFHRIVKKKLLFPKDKQTVASECYKNFVSKMLVKNPFERMSIAEALRHPWIQGIDSKEYVLNQDVYKYLRQFDYQTGLKRDIAHCLGDNMSAAPEQEVKRHFDRLDVNNDGCLCVNDLKQLLLNMGFDENKALEEANVMLSVHSVNGSLDFLDFKAMWYRKLLTKHEQYINRVFAVFDDNGDGFVDLEELHGILGGEVEKIKRTLMQCDNDNDGKLSYKEFEIVMKEEIIDPSVLMQKAEVVINGYCGQIKMGQIIPKPIMKVILDYYCLLYIPC